MVIEFGNDKMDGSHVPPDNPYVLLTSLLLSIYKYDTKTSRSILHNYYSFYI